MKIGAALVGRPNVVAAPDSDPAASRAVRPGATIPAARGGPPNTSRAGLEPSDRGGYVGWIRRYVIFHDRRHPRDLGAEHVRQFLSALAVEQQVAPSTQNQALAALGVALRLPGDSPFRRRGGRAPPTSPA
jgi:hypothetical protein